MSSHEKVCKCVECGGQDPLKVVREGIKKRGFSVIEVDFIYYTTGMCNGEKDGYEFACTGLQGKLSVEIFREIRSNLPQVKNLLKQAKERNSNTIILDNFLKYTNKEGQLVEGPLTLVLVTPENQNSIITMHGKFYKHKDFTTYQCLICDAEGKAAFDEGYDISLIEAQTPLFLDMKTLLQTK